MYIKFSGILHSVSDFLFLEVTSPPLSLSPCVHFSIIPFSVQSTVTRLFQLRKLPDLAVELPVVSERLRWRPQLRTLAVINVQCMIVFFSVFSLFHTHTHLLDLFAQQAVSIWHWSIHCRIVSGEQSYSLSFNWWVLYACSYFFMNIYVPLVTTFWYTIGSSHRNTY